MRVLVTGANGFVGAWLVRRLVADGHQVRTLVRPSSSSILLEGISYERMNGDVTDAASVRAALDGGVDTVFHLAGLRRSPTREAFFRVNADATRIVCEAMVAAKCRRLILASSLAALGPSSAARPHDEADPYAPLEAYGESKAEAERVVLGFADRLEVVISRPSRILGAGDKENLVFFKLANRGLRLAIHGGPRPLTLVDVEDVVEHFVLLATREEAVGQAFFVGGPQGSLEELQDAVAEQLHSGARRTLKLSPSLLRALATAADGFSKLTGRHLPLNRKLAQQLLAPAWTCSGAKSERLLGFKAQRDLKTSITDSYRWYREHGWL